MDSQRFRRMRLARLATLVIGGGAIVIAATIARLTELPPATAGYSVTMAEGVSPVTTPERAAALARHYLDEQTPELVAPNQHTDPVIVSVSAMRAGDAPQAEPLIPAAAAEADPRRVVWVASVRGDFLNLHDLAWSVNGAPAPSGTIVIDDATGTILGVYPYEPGR